MSSFFRKVLLIDDDRLNNYLNIHVLKAAIKDHTTDILSFTDPQEGLQHIFGSYSDDPVATVLFLDINMPALTGWDVLDKLKVLDKSILQHLTIYMLSSSIDPADIARAKANFLVKDYISKPLAPHISRIFKEAASITLSGAAVETP